MNKPVIKQKYLSSVVPQLMKDFNYTNVMGVPSLLKIVLNMGLGEAIKEPKLIDAGLYTLGQITGQKPVITRSKQAISNFKLREGLPIGCCVTLRGDRMYEFLERLVNFALPRVRDFRGVSKKAFDGHGNYTLGLTEQLMFPEIDYDKIPTTKGMNITFVTTAKSDDEGRGLLKLLGMPFRA
ncbi:MAG: 50S ribosomal protein L5 [Nitrospinota bacterium]